MLEDAPKVNKFRYTPLEIARSAPILQGSKDAATWVRQRIKTEGGTMAFDDIWSELQARLPELKAEHARIGQLIAAIEGRPAATSDDDDEGAGEAAARRTPANGSRTLKPSIGRDDFTGLSTSEAIKKYLAKMGRGNPQGPREMAQAMIDGGRGDTEFEVAYANVTSALKRLKKNGEVRPVRRGEWGLSSWYTNQGVDDDA